MEFSHRSGATAAILACFLGAGAHAGSYGGMTFADEDAQLRRLMSPTEAEQRAEQRGRVHIYDALEINQVDAALDAHFDRIQNMMFIRVQHPVDDESGDYYVADDGCD